MARDRLLLKDMVFYGRHGVYASEQALGQRFEVDVELYLDLAPAGRADQLEAAINYVDVYGLVRETVEGPPFRLIEAVAETIAQRLLERYSVQEVVVRVRKPHAPIGGLLGTVEVQVARQPSAAQS